MTDDGGGRPIQTATENNIHTTRKDGQRHTRRRFLQTALGISLTSSQVVTNSGAAQAASNNQQQQFQTDGAEFSGRIVTPNKNPINGAVQVYDTSDNELLFRTETDSNGQFSFSQAQLNSILATNSVNMLLSGEEWFNGYASPSEAILENNGSDYVVNKQLLYGPKIAKTDARPLGQISIWRQVGFSDPQKQVISVEVTNTSTARRNRMTGSIGSDSTNKYNYINADRYDLTSGIFTLSHDEDAIDIDYGPVTDIDLPLELEVVSVNTPVRLGGGPLETYHPSETGIPMTGSTQVNYSEVVSTEAEETISEGTGHIVGAIPVVSDVLGVADALEWALGDPLSVSSSLGLENPPKINPNEMDTATLPWKSDQWSFQEASVVAHFPIRLNSDNTTIDIRAEWRFEDPPLAEVGTGQGFFAERFEISPYAVGDDDTEEEPIDSETPVAEEDLISWWQFNQNFNDAAGDNDASVPIGNPQIEAVAGRTAVRFDGDDGMRVARGGNQPELSLLDRSNGPASITMQVYFADQTSSHSILRHDTGYRITAGGESEDSSINLGFSVSPHGDTPSQGYSMPDDVQIALSTQEWHQLSFVLNSTEYIRIYANGEQVFADDSMEGYNNVATDFWPDITIGSWYGGNPEKWGKFMNGAIRDLRIYDTGLTAEEVSQIYTNTN